MATPYIQKCLWTKCLRSAISHPWHVAKIRDSPGKNTNLWPISKYGFWMACLSSISSHPLRTKMPVSFSWYTCPDTMRAFMTISPLKGPFKGGCPSSPSEFQSLVCRYFGRFPCRCRNFSMTSLRLCWPSSEEIYQTSISYVRDCGARSWVRGLEPTGFELS